MEVLMRVLRYIISGRSGFVFEIAVCEILFAIGSKPRKWPWLTIPLAIVAHLLFGLLIPYFNRVSLVIFAVSILLQFAVLKLSIHRVIFNSVAAYATQNLAINIRTAIRCLTGWTGAMNIFIAFLTDAIVYTLCYFIFAKKGQRNELRINYFYLYAICFLTTFVTNVLFWYLTKAVGEHIESSLTLCICCLVALMLQYNALQRGVVNYESAVLERLLYMEQKQHDISQENIEIINYKCHDLKRQITTLKELFGDKTAAEIFGEAEKAVEIYDKSVNTKNKNLDLVINGNKLLCDKYDIALEIMADGSLLDFMAPADIYSLFENALQNAFESVKEEEEGFRTISLNIHESEGGGYVVIEIKNFCTRKLKFLNGKPISNKADPKFHGYGIRSMEYIVEKYGGNMVINYQDNIFLVKILFKIPT